MAQASSHASVGLAVSAQPLCRDDQEVVRVGHGGLVAHPLGRQAEVVPVLRLVERQGEAGRADADVGELPQVAEPLEDGNRLREVLVGIVRPSGPEAWSASKFSNATGRTWSMPSRPGQRQELLLHGARRVEVGAEVRSPEEGPGLAEGVTHLQEVSVAASKTGMAAPDRIVDRLRAAKVVARPAALPRRANRRGAPALR